MSNSDEWSATSGPVTGEIIRFKEPTSFVNGESIATGSVHGPRSVEDSRVCYVTSAENKDHDTFHRHGFFALNQSGSH